MNKRSIILIQILIILMSLLSIAEIVFFLTFGISHFAPFKHSRTVCAFSALVVGVVMLIK